ncbi:MAG: ATP-binding protein [Legionellales bacterium]|nr:ATP-binding protein [Legionellales bacterium]
MQRTLLTHLIAWHASNLRKPLVIRGARQVGKTWLVRHFAEHMGLTLIELNFEKYPTQASLFESNNTEHILVNLSMLTQQKIDPQRCLLFLDEIQSAPQILSKLRWLAEDLPDLAVIAAGSLLEFILDEHSFSMPVGRISYLHLEPLSFEEFLLALDEHSLHDYLHDYHLTEAIPAAIHEKFDQLFKDYLLVGGLPACVAEWVSHHSFISVNQLQHDLLATYRDDFSKYKGKIAIARLDEVMITIPRLLGQKVIFSKINKSVSAATLNSVLHLLEKARLTHRVPSCAANGIPLAAELNQKYFKEIFLDVGLCSTALGLNLKHIQAGVDITLINNGGMAEQVAGQLLRTIDPPFIEPALYYWQRQETSANAEIDYIIQHANQPIPIEIKAGSTGSLKSLHYFMRLKKFPLAMRINSDYPSKTLVDVKDTLGQPVNYSLISLPFYLIGQIHRLLDNELPISFS